MNGIMQFRRKCLFAALSILTVLVSSCGPGQLFGPTFTPPPSQTPTSTSTPTMTPSPTLTPTPITTTYTIKVPATSLWVNTNIKVVKGQSVTIRAGGTVNTWGGRGNSTSDANGQTKSVCTDTRCPMAGAYYGELIGRLGVGSAFRVDTSLDFLTPGSGTLFLSINDWDFKDNIGEFNVVVTVK